VIGSLGCPQLKAIDESQLKQFPDYSKQPVAELVVVRMRTMYDDELMTDVSKYGSSGL
jgi:hypothetical protein